MCRRRVGHWGTRKGPAELDREGGWSIPERARSDEDVCSEGYAETGRRTDGKSNCLCSESRTQGRGDENTCWAHGTATRSQNHLLSYPPVCLHVSALYSFFFFFFLKLSAQKHTLALLTLAKYGLTGHSFDKNYSFQWFFSHFFSGKNLFIHTCTHYICDFTCGKSNLIAW